MAYFGILWRLDERSKRSRGNGKSNKKHLTEHVISLCTTAMPYPQRSPEKLHNAYLRTVLHSLKVPLVVQQPHARSHTLKHNLNYLLRHQRTGPNMQQTWNARQDMQHHVNHIVSWQEGCIHVVHSHPGLRNLKSPDLGCQCCCHHGNILNFYTKYPRMSFLEETQYLNVHWPSPRFFSPKLQIVVLLSQFPIWHLSSVVTRAAVLGCWITLASSFPGLFREGWWKRLSIWPSRSWHVKTHSASVLPSPANPSALGPCLYAAWSTHLPFTHA